MKKPIPPICSLLHHQRTVVPSVKKIVKVVIVELNPSKGGCTNKVSNSPDLLKELSASSYVFGKEFQDASVKTLGLWDPKVDFLTYKVKITDKVNLSKRDELSEIARLYEPLCLIGTIVTKAKILVQGLWKIKLDWSEQLPPDQLKNGRTST
ncbi:integrase catalytic domain-containing protein [Trichonephila clavipes]|nr:integrase catalytic domain-containing protein [Trichonephila clavipes]